MNGSDNINLTNKLPEGIEPREWWICAKKMEAGFYYAEDREKQPDLYPHYIHVIEYAAFSIAQEQIKELVSHLEFCVSELKPYAAGRRDQSFPGWSKTWKEIEIEHSSDYEYYPNHITKEIISDLEKTLEKFKGKKDGT